MAISPEKLHYYEEAFQKVQEATGINDIDELVTKLLEAEEKNFSLFNYVNELNNEIEQVSLSRDVELHVTSPLLLLRFINTDTSWRC